MNGESFSQEWRGRFREMSCYGGSNNAALAMEGLVWKMPALFLWLKYQTAGRLFLELQEKNRMTQKYRHCKLPQKSFRG